MTFVICLGSRHDRIANYSIEKFADYVAEMPENRIIVAAYSEEDVIRHRIAPEIDYLISQKTGKKLLYAGSGAYDLEKERQKVLSRGGDDPDFVTKKNIMEMMDTTIWTYLSSFWTDPAKVNSNETDSIFSARKLMRTSFVPEIESDLWVPFMNRTVDNVKHIDNFQEAIILCDPESMFYLKQKLVK